MTSTLVATDPGSLDESAPKTAGGADQLFAALDGRVITSQGDTWELRIFGIYPGDRRSWLQFRLAGPQQIDAFLAVDSESPAAAIRAIRAGLDERASRQCHSSGSRSGGGPEASASA